MYIVKGEYIPPRQCQCTCIATYTITCSFSSVVERLPCKQKVMSSSLIRSFRSCSSVG